MSTNYKQMSSKALQAVGFSMTARDGQLVSSVQIAGTFFDGAADRDWDANNNSNTFHDFGGNGGFAEYGNVTDIGDGFQKNRGDRPSGCFNCGEEGHNKVDCPNKAVQREFSGTCYVCHQTGHTKSTCPNAPAKVCKNCEEEGHEILGCTNPRKNRFPEVVSKNPTEAWETMLEAAAEGDMLGVKQSAHDYASFITDLTYPQLEKAFRSHDIRVYLIAVEAEPADRYSHMDLQGNLGKKYLVTFRKSPTPSRAADRDGWPSSPEENSKRLIDAGHLVDCLMPKCSNCDALGHTMKSCKEEKVVIEREETICYNCNKPGHRQRDCTEKRIDKFACKNCGGSGHGAKECPEPLNMDNVECKECNEKGHFARDCPTKPQIPCFNCGQTGHRKADCTNEAVLICRNCDEQGHVSKDCPKPRNYSRVTCRNCGEKGHTQVRCTQPPKEDEGITNNDNEGETGGTSGDNNYTSGDANFGSGGGGGDNWESINNADNGGGWNSGAW